MTLLSLAAVVFIASADTLRISIAYVGDIEDNDTAQVTIKTLEAANPGDEVYIYMTSDGGRVDIGYNIVEAMQHSKAKVVVVVNEWAASMAANIVCEAPNYVIGPKATLMWHMAFYVDDDGKRVALDPKDPGDKAIIDRADQTFRDCGFLTEKEIKLMDNGGEVYLSGKDIHDRLKKMSRG